MDDQHDDSYEILDLGPTRNDRRTDGPGSDSPADDELIHAPGIDLGEAEGPSTSAPPKWQRWAVMLAVFAAGVAAGGYGWHSRTEAIDGSRVDLIGVDVRGDIWENLERSRFFAQIHNAGNRDVTVVDLRWPETPEARSDDPQEVTIAAGDTQGVVARGQFDCDAGRPQWLEADVHTEAGLTSVLVPVVTDTVLDVAFAYACGQEGGVQDPSIFFAWDGAQAAFSSSTYHMVMRMDHDIEHGEIIDITAGAPGYVAAPVNLPIEVRRGVPVSLELDWTVTDCATTKDLGAVDVELVFTDRRPLTASLPDWAIAELSRFAVAECGS